MNTRSISPFSRRAGLKAAAAFGLGSLAYRPAFAHHHGSAPSQTPASTSGLDAGSFVEFMQMVKVRMAEERVPSVAVGVVHNAIRTTCGLGVTNVEAPELASAQTFFRVASLSKLFTGSAIASLADSGAIDLNAPVRTYLPLFSVQDPVASDQVLVRHLLTHSAGWHGTLLVDPGPGDDALRRYVERMSDLPQVTRPGDHFSYNNAAFILAGHLIAEVTGQVYESAMRDLTLSPLSMDTSSFAASDLAAKSVASGHIREGEKLTVIEPWESVRAAAPANGLLTNVDELLSFASFHANATRAKPASYLTEKSRIESHSMLGSGGSMGPFVLNAMGMSWMLTDVGGTQVSMHAGNDFGQSAMIAVAPSEGFAIVVLTNADAGRALALELVFKGLEQFLGLRPSIRETIDLPGPDLDTMTGRYRFIDGPELAVTRSGSDLRLDVEQDGQLKPGMSGDLVFVAPDLAELNVKEGALFVDFVRDDEGNVSWIRHLGTLASRSEA